MAKNKNEVIKDLPPIEYGEFLLVNREKLDRVILGTVAREGQMTGGLGENAPIEQILAYYDKLAGLITDKNGQKLKNGCFWDFKKKYPKETPEIVYRDNVSTSKTNIKVNVEEVGDKSKKGRKMKIEEE